MPVDRIQPLLNAYADDELPLWVKLRVQRHLKTCTACRAEYTAIQSVTAQARAWRDVTAPPELKARVESALSHPSEEDIPMVSHSSVFPRPAAPALRLRTLRWQPLVGASALAALAAVGALLFPGSPGHPTVAYADVQRAMQSVQAVAWTQTQTRYDLKGKMTLGNTQRVWVRRDPPAYAEQDGASSLPQTPGGEYAGPTRYLSDAQGQVNFHVRDGLYYLHPAQDIARQVQSTIDSLSRSQGTGNGKPERVLLNGRPALMFRQHIHTALGTAQMPDPARRVMDGDETLWADANTLRVLRKRSDVHWGPERIVQDATGFQYDTPAPAGVFDLAPPPGAHVTEDDGKGNKTVVSGTSVSR